MNPADIEAYWHAPTQRLLAWRSDADGLPEMTLGFRSTANLRVDGVAGVSLSLSRLPDALTAMAEFTEGRLVLALPAHEATPRWQEQPVDVVISVRRERLTQAHIQPIEWRAPRLCDPGRSTTGLAFH